MEFPLFSNRIKHWGIKGGLSIIDQIVFSGANFALNVLLARWLLPADYGAFALSYTILLVFYQLHSSLILDPMSILGPFKHAQRLSLYFGEQIRLHFFVSFVLGLTILLSTFVYDQFASTHVNISSVLRIMGLTLPFQLLPWLLRRMFYIQQNPGTSVLGSFIYAFANFAALLLLHKVSLLNSISAVIAMAIAAASASIVMVIWLKFEKKHGERDIISLFKQNWLVAGWLVSSAVLVVFAGQAQVFIAGGVLGIDAAGIVRALQNFAQPMILIVTAFGNLAIPILSADFGRADFESFHSNLSSIAITSTLVAASYWLMLLIFRHPVELLLYGGKFSAYTDLIPIWGMVPLLLAINVAPASALQAVQKPYALLVVSLFWMLASVGSAFYFSAWWGLWGISVSSVFGYAVAVLVFYVLYKNWVVKELVRIRTAP